MRGKKASKNLTSRAGRAEIEQRLAEALADVKSRRTYGPFSSAKATIRSLQRESRRIRKH